MIADFYGWLWIIGSLFGTLYTYFLSRRFYKSKKKVQNKVNNKKVSFIKQTPRSTLISNLPRKK